MALTKRQAKRIYADSGYDLVKALTEILNEQTKQFELLLQKLDADTGITDTDYEATLQTAAIQEIDLI